MRKNYRLIFCAALLAVCLLSGCLETSMPMEPAVSAPAGTVTGPAPARRVTALPYTNRYMLFEEPEGNPENPVYGLLDRDGNEVLPAKYKEISVAENGLLFVCDGVYRILKPDGTQIGPDYEYIESASPGADGVNTIRQASFLEMAAVPPYGAWTGTDDARQYWLLDKNGIPREDGPYIDLLMLGDGEVLCAKDGFQLRYLADGTLEKTGNEIVDSYFDGKFQVKSEYHIALRPKYGLLDRDGNVLAPAEYCRIQAPFEDRYILSKGAPEFLGGAQDFLYDDTGRLLADNSNHFQFTVRPDGSYVGLSFVGSPEEFVEALVLDEAGNPEPQGVYFVDKNGKRLSEGYRYIELYENEAQLENSARRSESEIVVRLGGSTVLDAVKAAPQYGEIAPEEAFGLCQTSETEAVKIPLRVYLQQQ